MKRYQAILMFLILVILLFPWENTNVNAEMVTGKLGDNITWKLENGVLTISGKGDMLDCKHKKISTWEGEPSCGYEYYEQRWGSTWDESRTIKHVVIEEGVTSIAAHAFCDFDTIETVVIPDSVTRIGHAAFYGCWNLHEVNLSNQVTVIEDFTFAGCALEKIKLSQSLKKIGYRAFDNNTDLKQISIPKSVEIIDTQAFDTCINLEKVTWEEKSKLREIKELAFWDCNIKTLTIPASVTKIQSRAVSGSYEIKVEKGSKKYKSKNGVLFSKDGKTLVCYPRKKKGNTYKIPKGVRTIGDYAFYYLVHQKGYPYLKKVTMPDSVRVIKSHAFEVLPGLKMGRLSKNLKRVEYRAFVGCEITSLKLPDSLVYIGDEALEFQNLKGTLVIPKNVKEIGKLGIAIPPKVKRVVVKSKKIKNLSKKAFCWNTNVTIVLPKSKKATYKKLFTKKRLGKKMKFIYQ